MPEITLTAEAGRPIGSRPSGRLRAAGRIPGVVYGHGSDPLPVSVDGRALRAALSGDAGLNALLTLDIDGQTKLAMAKDIQRDPVRNTVSHVDFLIVSRDEVVTADINIVLVGDAEAVHKGDGVVNQELFSLTIRATPDKIPHQLDVDISKLEIGDTIRVDDLNLPAGVSTDTDGETTVIVAQPPQVSEEDLIPEGAEAPAEAAEEGAEGAEAGAEAGEGGGDEASASDTEA